MTLQIYKLFFFWSCKWIWKQKEKLLFFGCNTIVIAPATVKILRKWIAKEYKIAPFTSYAIRAAAAAERHKFMSLQSGKI